MTFKPILALVLAAMATAPAAAGPVLPDPEVTICPPSPGDLEYGLHAMMTAAKFQEFPGSSPYSWRREADGPFHLPSLAAAEFITIEFEPFRTQSGTHLVAHVRWRTRTYEFGVREKKVMKAIQTMLDGMPEAFPCAKT